MLTRDLWLDVLPGLALFGPKVHVDSAVGESIEELAQLALKAAPQQFILIGFSMGGYVAREICRIAPERVLALVLIATSSRADNVEQTSQKHAAVQAAVSNFRGLSYGAVRQSVAPARAQDMVLIERIRAMSIQLGGEVFGRQAAIRRTGDQSRLGEIRCPTLIVAGQHDQLRSLDESIELQQGIPGAELVVLDAGHMVPLESPTELVAALSAFLKRLL